MNKTKKVQARNQRLIFVAARSGPNSAFVLEAINQALEAASSYLQANVSMIRSDLQYSRADVLDSALNMIGQADLVIADLSGGSLSGGSSNVLLEMGYAQGLGKPVLLLSDDVNYVPSDLQGLRTLLYQTNAPISNLALRLRDAILIYLKGSSPRRKTRATPETPKNRGKAFISYSHADQEFLVRILVHL